MAKPSDLLSDAKEAFRAAQDAENENRAAALDDIQFARIGGNHQWMVGGVDWAAKRAREGRPCLTINMLPKFIHQVMNDIRQNRPAIKVRPVDSGADVKTAEVYTGLIRNIEQQSHSDTAWDTAAEHAISGGFGYATVSVDDASDDTFDQDIRINRVANQFSIYGDPNDSGADSANWNSAFQVELITKERFMRRFKGAEIANWNDADYKALAAPWRSDDEILIAGWWVREETTRKILKLSNGRVVGADEYAKVSPETGLSMRDIDMGLGVTVEAERDAPSFKVTHHLMTGAEILKSTPWVGRYIPIIPVYGEEVNIEGKRTLKSLIRDGRDPQTQLNFWRTYAAELIALAPKAPFIGPTGAFDTDPNWTTANSDNHPFLEYDGSVMPTRQPYSGIPAGALNQAMLANDDIKSTLGMFDASLGQKSNETSGKAILARQREGDVATFHFADNLARAIRHAGGVILDLIPKVYGSKRMIRILGEDGKAQTVQIGPKPSQMPGQMPMGGQMPPGMPMQPGAPVNPVQAMAPGQEPAMPDEVFDLTVGKYDLVVQAGPSFTTRREETSAALTEMMRSAPQFASALGPLLLKTLDVPGIDEISAKLEQASAAAAQQNDPAKAEMAKVQAQAQAKMAEIQANAQADQMKAQADALLAEKKAATDAALALKKANDDKELAWQKAQWDAELAAWKAGQQAKIADENAQRQAARQAAGTPSEAPESEPSSVDMAALVADAVRQGMSNVQIKLQMPRIRRVPVRDQNGLIVESVDEPIEDMPQGATLQ